MTAEEFAQRKQEIAKFFFYLRKVQKNNPGLRFNLNGRNKLLELYELYSRVTND